ncbi:MAG: hypothetical protein GF400_11025 [Candidatus Eisenbacteria bacterium]|nr:hypothetical protein [Candidatus Eisenbacteria bacterium]
MQTNSYADWMRRPLSAAVCPTPDLWPEYDTVGSRGPRGGALGDATAGGSYGPTRIYTHKEDYVKEEKLRVLKMLEDGKITADEASRLMEVLDRSESRPTDNDIKRKWLHIRVQEAGRDRDKVNIRVPLALLKFGFKLAPKFARQHVKKAHRHAERARARAEREREKAVRKARRTAERVKRDLEGKLGEHPGLDIEAIVNEAIEESLSEMDEAIREGLEEAGEDLGTHVHEGLGVLADKNLDLDLDAILEMAQSEGFDGKILDVYDEDDDEHVTITLE